MNENMFHSHFYVNFHRFITSLFLFRFFEILLNIEQQLMSQSNPERISQTQMNRDIISQNSSTKGFEF